MSIVFDNLELFFDELAKILSKYNIGLEINNEQGLRFIIAKYLEKEINKLDKDQFRDDCILGFESKYRTDKDISSKIDLSIYYYPKEGENFSSVFEIKRGADDNHSALKKINKNPADYFMDNIEPNTIAEDLHRIVSYVTIPTYVKRFRFYNKLISKNHRIINATSIVLIPEKRKFRRSIFKKGVDFWNSYLDKYKIESKIDRILNNNTIDYLAIASVKKL